MNAAEPALKLVIAGGGAESADFLECCSCNDDIKLVGAVAGTADAELLESAKAHGVAVYATAAEALAANGACLVCDFSGAGDDAESAVISGAAARLLLMMSGKLKSVTEQLDKKQARMHAIMSNVRAGIFSFDASGVIEDANPAMERVLGYAPHELIGQHIDVLMPSPLADGEAETADGAVPWLSGEITARHKDGHKLPLELEVAEMRVAGSTQFLGLVRDLTERKTLENSLKPLSLYDHLTGLPNRTMFLRQLSYIVAQRRRNKVMTAVMFINLDNFKSINAYFGHDIGDYVLRETGRRLEQCLRESDVVARLSGDEFVIALSFINAVGEAEIIAERIVSQLRKPIHLLDHLRKSFNVTETEVLIAASLGIAIYPDHGTDAETLINNADHAMYLAKTAGANRYCFLEPIA